MAIRALSLSSVLQYSSHPRRCRARTRQRKQLVAAIVTGYEIMPRFQENAGLPDLGARGWAGSTNLAFSVPLACAHLLNLNKDQAIDALGMSVTHGTVMDGASHGQMPTSKSLLDGVQVMNAV